MITGLLLTIPFTIFYFIVGLLPTGALPTQVSTAFNAISSYMYSFNGIFPIDTLFTLLGYALILQATVLSWNFILLIANYFRGR